jgi:SAM-dependent methyltransferase
VREERYRSKFKHRGRGLADLHASVAGVMADIDERLARKPVVRVLELGCGFGVALLDLHERYGERVEAFGVNRTSHDGGSDSMQLALRDRGRSPPDSAQPGLPEIVHTDVAGRLPFEDESFDLVYSQVAWLYFSNKIGVVREVMRLLRADGVAKIDADEVRPGLPPEYARLVEIWENGRILPFGDYVRRYGGALEAAPDDGQYLRFGKQQSFGEDLERVVEIDVSAIHPDWDGIKCVYRLRPPPDRQDATPATNDRGT